MPAKGKTGNKSDWRDRIHEIEFTQPELDVLRKTLDDAKLGLSDWLISLLVDNVSIKVKSVEHYSSYTFSYTLDKNDPKYPAHTFWFYDTEIERGIMVMAAFVTVMLTDYLDDDRVNTRAGLW